MSAAEINYWTAVVAVFLGVPTCGLILGVGVLLEGMIRGKSGRISRGRDHFVVDFEPALFGRDDAA